MATTQGNQAYYIVHIRLTCLISLRPCQQDNRNKNFVVVTRPEAFQAWKDWGFYRATMGDRFGHTVTVSLSACMEIWWGQYALLILTLKLPTSIWTGHWLTLTELNMEIEMETFSLSLSWEETILSYRQTGAGISSGGDNCQHGGHDNNITKLNLTRPSK